MAFLKNAWYCAGWGNEVGPDDLLGRKLLGESVLLYRKEDGTAVAIGNACPHRFAPLSMGNKVGDDVACPYHGLAFNSEGECTLNPFSDTIPAAAKVASYPLVEKWQALWIWMGDPDKADESKIPDFSMCEPREGWAWVCGHHETEANYKLVVDNLLDRSHVQFMHPLLIHGGAAIEGYEDVQSFEQVNDDMLWDYHYELNCPKYKLLGAMWPDAPELTENYFDVRWEVPGHMLLDAGTTEMGSDRKVGSHTKTANLITPIDENNTHYFWAMARDRQLDAETDEKIRMGVGHTFKNEDGAMVAACQELMNGADLMDLNPVFLPGDTASVRARRIMDARIAEEQAAEATEVPVSV